jgi:hypothetical protein
LFVNRILTANCAGTRVGALDSPEFTGFNEPLIIGIRCREGTELDMGMARILLCWLEDAIFSAAERGLTQSGHEMVALSPSPSYWKFISSLNSYVIASFFFLIFNINMVLCAYSTYTPL